MRTRKAVLLGVLGITVALLAVLSGISCFQRTLVYAPTPYTEEQEAKVLARYGIAESAKVDLLAKDGTRLRGYWLPHPDGDTASLPTVLYLHGNMGKLEWGMSASRSWQRHMPVNFFVISYRGFGQSHGTPDMEGVMQDSQAAFDWLLARRDVDDKRIVLYGHSLGGAVALKLAASNPGRVSAVILENTFVRLARVVVGNETLAELVEPFFLDRWDNERQVSVLAQHATSGHRVPHLLLLAGMKDRTVPAWHSEALHAALHRFPMLEKVARELHGFEEGLHTCHAQPGYHARIRTFLERIEK